MLSNFLSMFIAVVYDGHIIDMVVSEYIKLKAQKKQTIFTEAVSRIVSPTEVLVLVADEILGVAIKINIETETALVASKKGSEWGYEAAPYDERLLKRFCTALHLELITRYQLKIHEAAKKYLSTLRYGTPMYIKQEFKEFVLKEYPEIKDFKWFISLFPEDIKEYLDKFKSPNLHWV